MRTILGIVVLAAALGGAYFWHFHANGGLAQGAVTVKVLMPDEVNELAPTEMKTVSLEINKVTYRGDGQERVVKVNLPRHTSAYLVSVSWEPNNYTKIRRKRPVEVRTDVETVVDLRKADPSYPDDDIVVRWVPTPDDMVEAMCRLAKVGPKDIVYDLGCGDGRMVITAVKKFGAKRGVGIDIDPSLVNKCAGHARAAGIADKVEFRQGDVLNVTDLSDATVVLLYMGHDINLRLRPILQKTLKPGARVVSHRFTMGDWRPDQKEHFVSKSDVGYEHDILLWRIK